MCDVQLPVPCASSVRTHTTNNIPLFSCKPDNYCPRKISTQQNIELWAYSTTIGMATAVYTWTACLDVDKTLQSADRSNFNEEGCMLISAMTATYSGSDISVCLLFLCVCHYCHIK